MLAILFAAWLIRKIVHRAIDRMCTKLADGVAQPNFTRGWHHNGQKAGSKAAEPSVESTLAAERPAQRAATCPRCCAASRPA